MFIHPKELALTFRERGVSKTHLDKWSLTKRSSSEPSLDTGLWQSLLGKSAPGISIDAGSEKGSTSSAVATLPRRVCDREWMEMAEASDKPGVGSKSKSC